MRKTIARFLLVAISLSYGILLTGCSTKPVEAPARQIPASCMVICPVPDDLPEDVVLTGNDILENHVDSMEAYANCAKNHRCLSEWITAGEK